MKTKGEVDTGGYSVIPAIPERTRTRIASGRICATVGGLSHEGLVRTNNEDHYLVAHFGRFLHPTLSNLPEDFAPPPHEEIGYGLLVADGLGGMAAGISGSLLKT
jgi:protein phosphatase